MRNSWARVVGATAAAVVVALAAAGCGSTSATGSTSGSQTASTGGSASSAGGTSGSDSASSSGIASAQAQVEKFAANPPLSVTALPSAPKTSVHAIQINCTIPACAPGAMKPAMAVLGWNFEELPFDISKGPSAEQQALAQAIAAKPDVIFVGGFPESTFQSQIDQGTKEGIKFIDIGGALTPGYYACIQCRGSLQALGGLAADIALADAGSKTDIAVASDDSIPPLKAQVDGIKQELAQNGQGSVVQEVPQSVSATPADNASRIVSFLQRNPSVKYVISTEQFVNPAALNSAGLGSRVKLIGIYPLNGADVSAVKNGQVFAYATGELASLYWRAADAAARAVEGIKLDPIDPTQSLRVMNKSNADISLLDPANYQEIYKAAWHH